MGFSIGILLRFSDMNPRPMGPIDTSSQSLMCLLTPQSPNPSGTARSLSWFFRYVKRDTLTWRRVRAEKLGIVYV